MRLLTPSAQTLPGRNRCFINVESFPSRQHQVKCRRSKHFQKEHEHRASLRDYLAAQQECSFQEEKAPQHGRSRYRQLTVEGEHPAMVEVISGAGIQGSLGQPGGGRETVILQRGSPPIRSPRRDLSQEAVPVGAVLITIPWPGPFNCVPLGSASADLV